MSAMDLLHELQLEVIARAASIRPDHREWLHTPNLALGGLTPAWASHSIDGAKQVLNLLDLIEHGGIS